MAKTSKKKFLKRFKITLKRGKGEHKTKMLSKKERLK